MGCLTFVKAEQHQIVASATTSQKHPLLSLVTLTSIEGGSTALTSLIAPRVTVVHLVGAD
jgi:hypothetical protein